MWFKVIGATKFSCLYVIVASFLSSLSLEQENDNLKQFLEFSKLHIIVQKLVDNLLPENCSRSVKDLIKLLQSQELEITINRKVSMTFQAHFFHFKSGNFLMSIPENFDPTMRQIYLASDVPASETKILYYVPCLKWYFNKFGKFCFFVKSILLHEVVITNAPKQFVASHANVHFFNKTLLLHVKQSLFFVVPIYCLHHLKPVKFATLRFSHKNAIQSIRRKFVGGDGNV